MASGRQIFDQQVYGRSFSGGGGGGASKSINYSRKPLKPGDKGYVKFIPDNPSAGSVRKKGRTKNRVLNRGKRK